MTLWCLEVVPAVYARVAILLLFAASRHVTQHFPVTSIKWVSKTDTINITGLAYQTPFIWITPKVTPFWPTLPWSLRAKLIVPPALAPGAQADHTSPWMVIAGDAGCPGIAHHFLAGAEQSSGPFAPWLTIFLVCLVTWTGHPRFPRLKDNQVDPKLQYFGLSLSFILLLSCSMDKPPGLKTFMLFMVMEVPSGADLVGTCTRLGSQVKVRCSVATLIKDIICLTGKLVLQLMFS